MDDRHPAAVASALKARASATDLVLANLRANHLDFHPRHRQGVTDRYSMRASELRSTALELRRRVEAGESTATSDQSIACCIGVLSGLSPSSVRKVVLNATSRRVQPAFWLDVIDGSIHYDLDRILEAAASKPHCLTLPATREVRLRLPRFLHIQLKRRYSLKPNAQELGELLGPFDFKGRAALVSGPGYRLKRTLARCRKSLGMLLIDQGIFPATAALSVLDFQIATKSNFAYLTIPAEHVAKAQNVLYAAIGWDETHATPALIEEAGIGSLSTPDPIAVTRCFHEALTRLRGLAPGQRSSIEALFDHHNAYARYSGLYVAFATAARQLSEFEWPAMHTERHWFKPFGDKVTGVTGRPRVMLLSDSTCRQIKLYRNHCAALRRRLLSMGSPYHPLHRHLAWIAAERNVPLIFRVDKQGHVRLMSRNEFQRDVSERSRLPPDAGRHYFGTYLYHQKVLEALLDMFLRHAEAGVESLSSTSIRSLRSARHVVCTLIDAELARLEISPAVGLSSR